jgi:PII-like signaling protein
MQSDVERQLIPSRTAYVEPVGFGDGTIDQVDPFDVSTNVAVVEVVVDSVE